MRSLWLFIFLIPVFFSQVTWSLDVSEKFKKSADKQIELFLKYYKALGSMGIDNHPERSLSAGILLSCDPGKKDLLEKFRMMQRELASRFRAPTNALIAPAAARAACVLIVKDIDPGELAGEIEKDFSRLAPYYGFHWVTLLMPAAIRVYTKHLNQNEIDEFHKALARQYPDESEEQLLGAAINLSGCNGDANQTSAEIMIERLKTVQEERRKQGFNQNLYAESHITCDTNKTRSPELSVSQFKYVFHMLTNPQRPPYFFDILSNGRAASEIMWVASGSD